MPPALRRFPPADFTLSLHSRQWEDQMIAAIGALLTAISIMFSRLDRHHDAAMATPDLRWGLLQLDGLLENWLVAAQATNMAVATWPAASGDELEHRLRGQGGLASEVLNA